MHLARLLLLALLTFCAGLSWGVEGSRNLGVMRAEGQRLALVIGNDRYQSINKLQNARADAQAMARQLAGLGFAVSLKQDTSEKALKEALRQFKAQVGPGDVALVFYAGHGVQLGAANYLLPVDVQGHSEEQVRDEAIPLQRILDDLQERRAKFSLVIVDACRNNPFKGQGRAFASRGLAPTTAATGQMVLFSAGAGQEALDRLGPDDKNPNGLFTRILLKEMQRPGVSVDRVLRNVREEVVRLAQGIGHEQVPALYDQALGDFYFVAAPAQAAATAPAPAPLPQPVTPSVRPSPAPSGKPVTLVVPYAPGGLTDLLARKLLPVLARQGGGTFQIENIAGGSGTIGYGKVTQASPDGSTLLLATAQTLAVMPTLLPVDDRSFNPQAQLAPVSMVAHSTLVLASHSRGPSSPLPALLNQARQGSVELRYGSGGVGTFAHLMGAVLSEQAGIRLQHQPYKGQGPAINDLMAGQIDLLFIEPATIAAQVSAGKIRLLAAAGNQRSRLFPQAPTLAELGYRNAPSLNWFGLFAPAGTPANAVQKLQQALQQALLDDEFQSWMQSLDLSPPATAGPDYLSQRLRQDTAYWRALMSRTGIKAD